MSVRPSLSGLTAPKAPPPPPLAPPGCDHPGCTAVEGNFAEPGLRGLQHFCFAHMPAEARAEWKAYAGGGQTARAA